MAKLTKEIKEHMSKFLDKVEKHYPNQKPMRSENIITLEFMLKNDISIERTYDGDGIFEVYSNGKYLGFKEITSLDIIYDSQDEDDE